MGDTHASGPPARGCAWPPLAKVAKACTAARKRGRPHTGDRKRKRRAVMTQMVERGFLDPVSVPALVNVQK